METEDLFDCLWRRHVALSPSAQRLRAALKERGEAVVEDHVAFRTFDLSPVGLESLAAPWMDRGWVETGRYEFHAKRLTARSYSHQSGGYPRVFVSELRTQEFSGRLQRVARECVGAVDALGTDLLLAGRPWPAVDRATYDALRAESEYAAWLAVFGYVANHFTVSVNSLRGFDDLGAVNAWVRAQGVCLNTSGGEIKGTPLVGLEQSSTLADTVQVALADGPATLPSCYTEFAYRHGGFDGFVSGNADRIFESTDKRD